MTAIIPTCYGGWSLVNAVKSLRTSGGNDLRILVIADTKPISAKVKSEFKKYKVRLIENKLPGGQFKKVKQGLAIVKTDLVLFTQDDVIFHKDAIARIIEKFQNKNKVTMVTTNDTPLAPKRIIEALIIKGHYLAHRMSQIWNSGNNYLLYCGRALAFRTKFAKKMNIPDNLVSADAYLYFENKRLGGRSMRDEKAIVYFRCPATLQEQLKKSSRHLSVGDELATYFGKSVLNKVKIPISAKIRASVIEFIKGPHLFIPYLFILTYTRIFREDKSQSLNALWKVELSTKK